MIDDAKPSLAAIDDRQWATISEAIWQLENSWHADSPIEVSDLVPPSEDPMRPRVLVELIKVDQEHRWEAGDRKMLETYLDEWAELAGKPELVTELLEAECETRATTDTLPTPDEIRSRFPGICDRIDLERIRAEADKEHGTCRTEALSPAMSDTPAPALDDTPSKAGDKAPLRVGQLFGRYEIRRLLGQGGMGSVYLAYDTQLERDVALKVPRCDPATDQPLLERFLREAKTAAAIRHPNICPIYDANNIDGTYYLTMAFIEGTSLDHWLKGRTTDSRDVAVLVQKLARALDAVHASGIIHRDIKASNVMIDQAGEPLLMDFGLARAVDTDVRLSSTGALLGTPAYLSPEQVDGGDPDARSDIYGLGVLLYQMLTGQLPYRGTLSKVLYSIVHVTPAKPTEVLPDSDLHLEAVCLKAMAKSPADRYESAGELSEELEAYLQGVPRPDLRPTRRHFAWIGTLAAAAAILMATVIYFKTGDGTLELILDDPNAVVTIDESDRTAHTGKPLVLGVGKHTVTISWSNGDVSNHEYTIRWRGSRVKDTLGGSSGGGFGRDEPPVLVRWIETGKDVCSIALPEDDSRLYVGYGKGERGDSPIGVFDLASFKPSAMIPLERIGARGNPHKNLILSPDGRYLYTVNYYGESITRIAIQEKNVRQDLKVSASIGGNVWSQHIELTPDGQKLVVTLGSDGFDNSSNDRMSIVDISGDNFALTGEVELEGEPTSECGLAIDAKGEFAYVITTKQKPLDPVLYEVRLTPPYVVSRSLAIPNGELCGIALSSELHRVFVSDRAQRKIWVVDLETFEPLPDVQFQLPEQLSSETQYHAPGPLAMRSDRHLLVALCPDTRKLFCLDAVDGVVLARIGDLRERVVDAEFSGDLRRLFVASAGPEGGVAVIDLDSLLTRIVFASTRDGGGFQLYSMCGGGQQRTRLSENVFSERSPRWSPDGRRIAFLSDREGARVCIMDSDVRSVSVLRNTDPKKTGTTMGAILDWSPDGTEIAYIASDPKSIRSVNIDTGEVRTLHSEPIGKGYAYCTALSWSEDGTILFSSQLPSGGRDQEVFALDPRTLKVTQITDHPGTDTYCAGPAGSPDGKRVAFARQPGGTRPPTEICLADRDGTGLRVVTTRPEAVLGMPAWFPGGRRLTYALKAGDYHDIYAISSDGGTSIPLAFGEWDDIEPDVCSLLRADYDHSRGKTDGPRAETP